MNNLTQALDQLDAALGEGSVLYGSTINPRHHSDWSQHAPACPAALLLPATTEEVATALRICNANHQPVVPQGGMTGLAGGAVPQSTEIALSLERLDGIEEIDMAASTMIVRAGTRLEVIQQAAADVGLLFPLDFGARGSCQIGGNISTNAGGNSVIRYGVTRDLILGLEVVLADGRVLNLMNKMIKNNSGYDLKQCFIGSEGTLGVITRAVLKLVPARATVTTLLCALPNYESSVSLLRRLQRRVGTPEAFEVMWRDFYCLGVSWINKTPPLVESYPLFVLFDSVGRLEDLEALMEESMECGEVLDAVIANSHSQARALWQVREATGEFPVRLQPLNFDVSMPISMIGQFVETCRQRLNELWPDNRSYFFGHIGDSNLHLTIDLRSLPSPTLLLEAEHLIYDAVGEIGGAISAEHGIGLLKREFLHHSATPEAIETMRQLKNVLDPRGILNPGKILG